MPARLVAPHRRDTGEDLQIEKPHTRLNNVGPLDFRWPTHNVYSAGVYIDGLGLIFVTYLPAVRFFRMSPHDDAAAGFSIGACLRAFAFTRCGSLLSTDAAIG